MSRVLVTGATGFVGSVLCPSLSQAGFDVRAAVRRNLPSADSEAVVVGDIGSHTDWTDALRDVGCVMHLAARAHVMNDSPSQADSYLEVNGRGTQRLAEAAARAGVARFVFLSSVKVNGEETTDRPFTGEDTPNPQDAYARSKSLAEEQLRRIAATSAMEVVIVRSPLVYGPGVRANFLRLLRWVDREMPLPFGSVRNRRSLVNVWNLSDLLARAAAHPRAAGGVWMAADGEDLSTPTLIARIAAAMGRKTRLLPVPTALLRACGLLTGQSAQIKRLCGSLLVDAMPARMHLNWSPPVSVDEALARTVGWYASRS